MNNIFFTLNSYIFSIISIFLFSLINAIYFLASPKTSLLVRIISIIIIILIIYVSIKRDTYLPFLGLCAYPPSLVANEIKPNGANIELVIDVDYPDNSKVIYWGANSTNKNIIKNNPIEAYGDYTNSGIAIVFNKKAKITFFCPDKYKVNSMGNIKRHIHYRVMSPNNPLLSSVNTLYVNC